jgi:hypothetical protein
VSGSRLAVPEWSHFPSSVTSSNYRLSNKVVPQLLVIGSKHGVYGSHENCIDVVFVSNNQMCRGSAFLIVTGFFTTCPYVSRPTQGTSQILVHLKRLPAINVLDVNKANLCITLCNC